MSRVLLALGLSAMGGIGGLVIAAALVSLGEKLRARIIPALVSYAVGTLLGVAFLDLLPEASATLGTRTALGTALAGIVTFFALEKIALWRHARSGMIDGRPTGSLVLVGDAAHNFMDGALIGAAVLVSVPMAVTTALAVLAHEIPHELGDFAILLNAGCSHTRALLLNGLSECAGLIGAVLAVVALYRIPTLSPYFLAFASASFVYVAMADLIPEMHHGAVKVGSWHQVVLVVAGVMTVVVV